jgi:hypothetical protein
MTTGRGLAEGQETLLGGTLQFGRIPIPIGRTFIERYEWLGHAGRALIFYGAWSGDQLYGVEAFTPVPYGLYRALGTEGSKTLYLTRGACCLAAGPHLGSALIGACLRDLRRRGYRIVVAFADARAGEEGVVYRAANAIYGGLTASKRTYYLIEGQWITDSTLWRCHHKKVSDLAADTPRKSDNSQKKRFYWLLHKRAQVPASWARDLA